MIDRNRFLLGIATPTPDECHAVVHEMTDVLNSMSVRLRQRGYDLSIGGNSDGEDLAYRLHMAWNHLYHARALLKLLNEQNPVPPDAPIWRGEEPPLDLPPSVV